MSNFLFLLLIENVIFFCFFLLFLLIKSKDLLSLQIIIPNRTTCFSLIFQKYLYKSGQNHPLFLSFILRILTANGSSITQHNNLSLFDKIFQNT